MVAGRLTAGPPSAYCYLAAMGAGYGMLGSVEYRLLHSKLGDHLAIFLPGTYLPGAGPRAEDGLMVVYGG